MWNIRAGALTFCIARFTDLVSNAFAAIRIFLTKWVNSKSNYIQNWINHETWVACQKGCLITALFSERVNIWQKQKYIGQSFQKQPPRGVSRKGCSENTLQIYMRTPTPNCNFKATLLKSHLGMDVLLLHIFRIPFLKEHFWRAPSVISTS